MMNDIEFVHFIIKLLASAGIQGIVFGGWAEELTGAIIPRPHKDLDLLYIGSDFNQIDKFLESQAGISEIKLKRFPHKRAFLYNGVMVELIWLLPHGDSFVTTFWNDYRLEWPKFRPMNIQPQGQDTLLVTPPSIVNYYRQLYPKIELARQKHFSKHPLKKP
jgi:hypothetical protein